MCKPNNFKYVEHIHLVLTLVCRKHLLIKGSVNLLCVLKYIYEHCSLLAAAIQYGTRGVEPIICHDILALQKEIKSEAY